MPIVRASQGRNAHIPIHLPCITGVNYYQLILLVAVGKSESHTKSSQALSLRHPPSTRLDPVDPEQ